MDQKSLQSLIGKKNKEELIQLIELLTQDNSGADRIVYEFCNRKSTAAKKSLIYENQILKLWNSARPTIDEANTLGGCSYEDEDETCEILNDMMDLIEAHELSWEYRKDILDEVLEQFSCDNSGFTDLLADVAEVLCRSDEEMEYLADFYSSKGNSYYKGRAVTIYRDLGKDQKFLKHQSANLKYESDFLKLADYYMEHQQDATALEIVLEGLEKCEGSLDGIYQYLFSHYEKNGDKKSIEHLYLTAKKKNRDLGLITELMYQYYKAQKNDKRRDEMLLCLIECCESSKVAAWYKQCEHELSTEAWKAHQPKLLKIVRNRNMPAYLDLCLENGDTKIVLKAITEEFKSFRWDKLNAHHKYSKILAKTYPEEIIDLYWKEVQALMQMSKEANYIEAVGVLIEIKAIMKSNHQEDLWNKQFEAFIETHKRKKLLMKAIEQRLDGSNPVKN